MRGTLACKKRRLKSDEAQGLLIVYSLLRCDLIFEYCHDYVSSHCLTLIREIDRPTSIQKITLNLASFFIYLLKTFCPFRNWVRTRLMRRGRPVAHDYGCACPLRLSGLKHCDRQRAVPYSCGYRLKKGNPLLKRLSYRIVR